jgi:hypothetical protein
MAEAEEPVTGTRGFFQPKWSNGSWSTIEGVDCTTCAVGIPGRDKEFYEESAWSYSWFVPHDYAKVIGLVGGAEEWVKRLGISLFGGADEIRFLILGLLMLGMNLGCYRLYCIIMLGNLRNQLRVLEDSLVRRLTLVHMVYLGTMTLVPPRSLRLIVGSLGAYLVWMMSGLVPIAGQSVYLILPPYFPEVQWTIPNSRIITHNFSRDNIFIQSVTVNGENVAPSIPGIY